MKSNDLRSGVSAERRHCFSLRIGKWSLASAPHSMGLRVGGGPGQRHLPNRSSALRFMGSLHIPWNAPWDLEPASEPAVSCRGRDTKLLLWFMERLRARFAALNRFRSFRSFDPKSGSPNRELRELRERARGWEKPAVHLPGEEFLAARKLFGASCSRGSRSSRFIPTAVSRLMLT
jgi:hypothetical protein